MYTNSLKATRAAKYQSVPVTVYCNDDENYNRDREGVIQTQSILGWIQTLL